jgi:hypothetical protein
VNVILLAADGDDANRWIDRYGDRDNTWIVHNRVTTFDGLPSGARIVRTDAWRYDPAAVSALRALHQRTPLVDPTGVLGPVDPDRRRPATGTPPMGAKHRHYHNLGTP